MAPKKKGKGPVESLVTQNLDEASVDSKPEPAPVLETVVVRASRESSPNRLSEKGLRSASPNGEPTVQKIAASFSQPEVVQEPIVTRAASPFKKAIPVSPVQQPLPSIRHSPARLFSSSRPVSPVAAASAHSVQKPQASAVDVKNEKSIAKNMVKYNPVANLSALLAKWCMDGDNNQKMADAMNRALNIRQEAHQKIVKPVESFSSFAASALSWLKPDRAQAVRDTKQFTAETVFDAFQAILDEKEAHWYPRGHTYGCGAASLNVLIIEEVVKTFREDMKTLLIGTALKDGFKREAISCMNTDFEFEKPEIILQRDAKNIYDATMGAVRAELALQSDSQRRFKF